MIVSMKRRAEIALNLSNETEQKKLKRALDKLAVLSPADFYHFRDIHKLVLFSGEKLYSLKGGQYLRIILSVNAENNEQCTVEDIMDRRRLEQLPSLKHTHKQLA
jgi:hypothetical protein